MHSLLITIAIDIVLKIVGNEKQIVLLFTIYILSSLVKILDMPLSGNYVISPVAASELFL